jgi:hypothetical protein
MLENILAFCVHEIAVNVLFDPRACLGREVIEDGSVNFVAGGKVAGIEFAVVEQRSDPLGDVFDAPPFVLQPDIVLFPVTLSIHIGGRGGSFPVLAGLIGDTLSDPVIPIGKFHRIDLLQTRGTAQRIIFEAIGLKRAKVR